FLKGRRIADCIGLVSEGFNLLDRKNYGGNVGIKVDIAKAFDTLNWQFLLQVLKQFGFSSRFRDMVHTILQSARLSILVNGSPHGFFSCARGVRQGDPLSPLLFCVAEEALSRGLSSLFSSGRVKSISLPRGCKLTHVLYADDLFIFCRGDVSSLNRLQLFLDSYGAASGQLVNKNKSTFYMGDSYSHRHKHVQRILEFKSGVAPFTYLGVPIFMGKPRRVHLQSIADKAKARLAGWYEKLLSMAGRVQLVHDIFQSLFLHSFSVYLWPPSLLKHLSACVRNFIWSGNIAVRKMVTVSWRQVCAPKAESGLGLRDLQTLNRAALLSMGWSTLTLKSLWSSFACTRFSISRHMNYRYFGSSLWHGLKATLPIIFQHSRWLIGDGKSVLFWSDRWLDTSLLDKLQVNRFPKPLTTTVASFISGQQWSLPHRFSTLFPALVDEIHSLPLPIVPKDDLLIWEDSGNGFFSFSEGYKLLRPHFASNGPHFASNGPQAQVWRHFIPPRFSILVWRLLHNKLPTDDQLQRRGIPLVS
ncbi:hypothetical protein ABKV19_002467, partial [Rosa sericea]